MSSTVCPLRIPTANKPAICRWRESSPTRPSRVDDAAAPSEIVQTGPFHLSAEAQPDEAQCTPDLISC